MKKHKTREEWAEIFKEYENGNFDWKKYASSLELNSNSKASKKRYRSQCRKVTNARQRFISKYNQWKLLDNLFMNQPTNKKGPKPKRDIEGFIKNLTREELEEIARVHIKEREKSKNSSSEKYGHLSIAKVSFVLNKHRTSFYKNKVERKYKFDHLKEQIVSEFYEAKTIYGRRRLSITLQSKYGIIINDRTLGRYLNRNGLLTKTRVARRKSEVKNIATKYFDLVKRDYNPLLDNIVATDVSYIPANEEQNNVYLSIIISHKTKMIESWEVSKTNDVALVKDTISKLNRKEYILHSDHGFQYSNHEVIKLLKKSNSKTSMSRIGNSLDNREAEYFFGCLKGEYLNQIQTHKMKLEEIKMHLSWYITWYNTKRIQKRLQWKTPTEVSVYAI